MRRRRWAAVMLIVSLSWLLAGCWDQLPMANRASALALSVTKAAPHAFRFTFYFPNPTVTVSSISNLATEREFYTSTAVAPALGLAYRRVQSQITRDLYLGQLEDIIISADLTTADVAALINAYNRMGVVPKMVYLVGTPNNRGTLPVNLQEPVPTVYFTKYFDCRTCQPVFLARREWKVWDAFETPGVSPVIPYGITPTRIDRLMVYPHRGRPYIMTRQETLGWGFLTNHMVKDTVGVRLANGLVVVNNVTDVAVTHMAIEAGHLAVAAEILARGDIAGWPESVPLTNAVLKIVERQLARAIIRDCLAAVNFANRTKTDPFGFTRDYLFRHPAQDLRDEKSRGMIWPLKLTVRVVARIPITGVTS
ncbi:MAG: spore gernimation protein GerC [Firmicutes bacterium]|nr:spore gernimation protein GerC [Bacillota bacterium]